jgi:Ni/Fe-hydrogenase subunit HybB-like protein
VNTASSSENLKEVKVVVPAKVGQICGALIVIGIATAAYTAKTNPHRFWDNILMDNFYFISIAIGAFFLLSMQYTSKMSWCVPFKRVTEALVSYLPVGFATMLGLCFGLHSLYEWTHTEAVMKDPILSQKVAYLNIPFFITRMVIAFAAWIIFSKILIHLSRKQDHTEVRSDEEGNGIPEKLVRYGVFSLISLALTFCMFAFDWIMSLEPHWFSTIFAVKSFVGAFILGLVSITLILINLQKWGYLNGVVNENHFHDLGKFTFAMCTFWVYTWISEFLLIWYANIPEETMYFVLRTEHGWGPMFYANVIINWVIPFLLLLPRKSKRNTRILGAVCTFLLFGRWLDTFLLVGPHETLHTGVGPHFGLPEIGIWLGYAGLFTLVVLGVLKKHPLYPKNDVYFDEGLHLHQ